MKGGIVADRGRFRTLATTPKVNCSDLLVCLLTLNEFGNRNLVAMSRYAVQRKLVLKTPGKYGRAEKEQSYPQRQRSTCFNDSRSHLTFIRYQAFPATRCSHLKHCLRCHAILFVSLQINPPSAVKGGTGLERQYLRAGVL